MSSKWFAMCLLLALAPSASRAAELSPPAASALTRALEDERHAESFYAAVIAKFGTVNPFANIIGAEQRHSSRVIDLLTTYGVAVPPNPYENGEKSKPSAPASLAEACKAGVQAEILNRDLYDKELLPAVAAYPDIVRVFTALRDASNENHLPAFRRCS